MEFSSLYLVIGPDNSQVHASILQMRTEIEPLTGVTTARNAEGETVLVLPPPVIEIARGQQDDLYGLAAKMFGARWGAWTSHGDYVHSYRLQGFFGAVPPGLTAREKSIVNALEAKPNQTADDLHLFLQVGRLPDSEKPQIASALRFLYENGFVVQESIEGITRYTIRRS